MSDARPREEGLVSVVVVTWNSADDIVSCLESLFAQSYSPIEVILVDNSSEDRTVQLVRNEFDAARIIRMEANSGFAHANNVGILSGLGEYILTINPDVVLKPYYVERLVTAVKESGPTTGSATGKLFREDGLTIDSTGLTMRAAIRFSDRGQGERDSSRYDSFETILGPCAAAALYRRAMLDDVNMSGEYFDSSFFAYFEDVDLALRARAAGWTSIYVPNARAVHKRGGSNTKGALVQFYAFRNRLRIIIKDIPASTLLVQAPAILVYDLCRLARVSITNPLALSSYSQVLGEMSTLLAKRREILKS
jgi:GT2 family glycosyltransferase